MRSVERSICPVAVFEWEKKKNRNALSPNAEGVIRGAELAEGARSFNAATGSGERCKLPSGVWGGAPAEIDFVAF